MLVQEVVGGATSDVTSDATSDVTSDAWLTGLRQARLHHAAQALRAMASRGGGVVLDGLATTSTVKSKPTRASRTIETVRSIREQLATSDRQSGWEVGGVDGSDGVAAEVTRGRAPARLLSVPLGDTSCDAASGGLRCGVVHELCGLYPCDAAVDAGHVEATDDAWLVPFGCLLHILRCVERGGDSSPALAELLQRGIVWIGDKVHPNLEALRDDVGDHALLQRSIFIRDSSDGCTVAQQRAMGAAAKHSNHAFGRICNRVWCAEQALRLGAAGVVIVDGSGFNSIANAIAWRRLQLAASESPNDAMVDSSSVVGNGSWNGSWNGRPLVLVVTPPQLEGELRRRGCAASTRWSVHCARGSDFRWRMKLESMRGESMFEASRQASSAATARALLESGMLAVDITRSRTARFTAAWAALRDRRPRDSTRVQDEQGVQFPTHFEDAAALGGAWRWQARSA